MHDLNKITVHKYMDGRYFALALEDLRYPGLVTEPLLVQTGNGKASIENTITYIRDVDVPTVVRMIISCRDCGNEFARHSNLLILHHDKKVIIRFEPTSEDFRGINAALEEAFPGYTVKMDRQHPQLKDINDLWCNAYVTEYARQWILHRREPHFGTFDPEKFSLYNMHRYGHRVSNHPDEIEVEFGPGGTLTGGLVGAGLGGLAFGAPGFLLGGLGGAAIGSQY